MLPKNRRIPRKIFGLITKSGQFYSNSLFNLRVVKQEDVNSRFCFSVSKKVSKKAFIRNRIRRAGYRNIKMYINDIKKGFLVALFFKKEPLNEEEVRSSLKSILEKTNLIK